MINIAHADNVKMIRMIIIEVDYTVYCIWTVCLYCSSNSKCRQIIMVLNGSLVFLLCIFSIAVVIGWTDSHLGRILCSVCWFLLLIEFTVFLC